ncbi:hypothetical protein PpBr36_02013 [Pyricularia pennisetigena]|uniref:hypothetical protein n=1 Tax=Pyricularia pennisetigena TaxID=1578925 RepID=UPI00114F7C42|nr:hypothetical protein PpBr36_02013 [Pyricularia pennisetigena]TLS29066.1 hypothetical protein PpBr36_02013 [Pyricularia pennisetigena]
MAQPHGRRLAHEPTLAQVDGVPEPSLKRPLLGRDVDAIRPEAGLHPQGRERRLARGDGPVRPAGLPQRIPQPQTLLRRCVDLPAGLADERVADRQHGHAGHDGRAHGAPRHGRQVVAADPRHDVRGARAPDADAARPARDVAHLHGGCRPSCRLQPGLARQVRRVDGAVDRQLERLVRQARHEDVAPHPAVVVQQQREGHGAGRPRHVARAQPLQQLQAPGPRDEQPADGGDVEQAGRGPRLPGLGGHDGGVVPGGPGVAVLGPPGGRQVAHEGRVGLEPVRALPAPRLEEVGAQVLRLPGEEGADAEVARRRPRLQRVDDVVDLDKGRRAGLGHVLARELHVVEPCDVAVGEQVDVRLARGQELGHGARDAGRVRDPDGLGDEEAVEVRGLADQRPAVGREGHDAVEARLDRGVCEGREQLLAQLPGRGEVLWGEGHAGRHVLLVDVARGRAQGGCGHGQGPMAVVADADLLAVLAVVEVSVLVAEDGERGAVGERVLAPQRRHRRGLGVLVAHGLQGHAQADHGAELDAPEARARQHQVGRDRRPGADLDARDALVLLLDARDARVLQVADPGLPRPLDQDLHRLGRQRKTVCGEQQASEDDVWAQQGVDPAALLRREQLRVDPPRAGVAISPLEVLEALWGLGDL